MAAGRPVYPFPLPTYPRARASASNVSPLAERAVLGEGGAGPRLLTTLLAADMYARRKFELIECHSKGTLGRAWGARATTVSAVLRFFRSPRAAFRWCTWQCMGVLYLYPMQDKYDCTRCKIVWNISIPMFIMYRHHTPFYCKEQECIHLKQSTYNNSLQEN